MNAIEMKNFSCYYKNKKNYIPALKHLDMTIQAGEFIVIVGPSGSGKTTFIKACLGKADFFEGDLFIDGAPVEQMDLRSGKYACVRQEIGLYPNMTVYENLAYPLRVAQTPQAEVDARVREMAQLLDIGYLLTRKPRQLSGGQQQRVAIGRAIIKDPAYIYFDEPFSNVDPALRGGLRELVRQLHSRFRPTVVFVTHDLQEAFSLAERIIVLEDGCVAEEGTPFELIQRGQSPLIRAFLEQGGTA